jgi:hypothetical protein
VDTLTPGKLRGECHARAWGGAAPARAPPTGAPAPAPRLDQPARVAESVDAGALKALAPKGACGFESHPGHVVKPPYAFAASFGGSRSSCSAGRPAFSSRSRSSSASNSAPSSSARFEIHIHTRKLIRPPSVP